MSDQGLIALCFVIVGIGLIFLMLWLFLLPARVADRRNHRQRHAIRVMNWCFGWTFFGWAMALIWAYTADVD